MVNCVEGLFNIYTNYTIKKTIIDIYRPFIRGFNQSSNTTM